MAVKILYDKVLEYLLRGVAETELEYIVLTQSGKQWEHCCLKGSHFLNYNKLTIKKGQSPMPDSKMISYG